MEEVKQTPAVEMVERTRIKTHPALQPRDLALLKQRERVRQEEQSEMHVHDMALLLKADPKAQLAALHLADVGGVLYVVDGHHRLQAYKRAKRDQVPAREPGPPAPVRWVPGEEAPARRRLPYRL